MKFRSRKKAMKQFEQMVRASCWSCCEGCCCNLPAHHEGRHECASPTCDFTWSTEQAREWEATLE